MSKQSESMVWIVDDDEAVRRSLARLVHSIGYRVESFACADTFLRRFPVAGPSCLVLDVKMPGLTGPELQEYLHKAENTVPIIFITGYGTIPAGVRAMKAGAVDYLQKPVDGAVLLDAIEMALARDTLGKQRHADIVEINQRLISLTLRQRQVLRLVAQGRLNKQIAYELGISEKTIKAHRAQVMRKMRVRSVAELVRLTDKVGEGELNRGFHGF